MAAGAFSWWDTTDDGHRDFVFTEVTEGSAPALQSSTSIS
jgi:hypothetical protein